MLKPSTAVVGVRVHVGVRVGVSVGVCLHGLSLRTLIMPSFLNTLSALGTQANPQGSEQLARSSP